MTTTTAGHRPCFWGCGGERPDHQHYTVIVREKGRLLGRLCPDGTATRRKIHAVLLSKARAERIAAEINARGEFTARVATF